MTREAPAGLDARDHRFTAWIDGLERRFLADLTFPEVSRALRALSSTYVERRGRIREGAALSGEGKRAAFALFYGPLHFLLVQHIVGRLPHATTSGETLHDLGCGTGAAGAAWAVAVHKAPAIFGVDGHPWAAEEARRTYRAFGLRGQARTADVARVTFSTGSTVLAAFVANELDEIGRDALLERIMTHVSGGGHALIVEPLAKSVAPWWRVWQRAFEGAGGRADEWRTHAALPAIVEKLDRAAGMNHRELTGRSLFR